MSLQTRRDFVRWSNLVDDEDRGAIAALISAFLADVQKVAKTNDSEFAAKIMKTHFNKAFSGRPKEQIATLQVALTSQLVINAERLIVEENLPDSVLEYYPMYFERIASLIREKYPAHEFAPHTQHAGLLSVQTIPCGAEVMDLKSCIPLTSAILGFVRMRDPRPLLRYFSVQGGGVWFRSHTDSNYLEEFNKDGFDRYYRRVADLLRRRPHVRGLVSTSWFHDPNLGAISPRLSYLYSEPLARGAFFIKHKSRAFDIQQATKTSPTRRALYEKGEYTPISYSIIWPRKPLLAWAAGDSGLYKEVVSHHDSKNQSETK